MTKVGTMTVTEFLLARIAEDEAVAEAALDRGFGGWEEFADLGVHYEERTHIARHHPVRVLAECEAKRQIVNYFRVMRENVEQFDALRLSDADAVLTMLANAYADHPDYHEEWRP